MSQQMFNPVDFGSFEWTGDWYRWDAVRGHLEAKRAGVGRRGGCGGPDARVGRSG